MGVAIYLELENAPPEFDASDVDGKALGRAWPDTGSNLLSPLEQFVSVTEEQRASFLDEMPDVVPVTIPPPQWFDAAAGLAQVRQILQVLRESPKALDASKSQRADAERVSEDLRGIERGLELAVEQGRRFHLAFDY